MKLIIIGIFVALMALGTSCAQISQPVAEVAPQGTSDGIQVHGHWTVTVSNPDGTVDAVHEFENALHEEASAMLSGLLTGRLAIDANHPAPPFMGNYAGWTIRLFGKNEETELHCERPEDQMFNGRDHFRIDEDNIFAAQVEDDGSEGIRLAANCAVEEIVGEDGVHIVEQVKTRAVAHRLNDDGTIVGENSLEFADITEHTLKPPIKIQKQQFVAFHVIITFE